MLKHKYIQHLEKRCNMDRILKAVLQNDNIYRKQTLKRGANILLPKMEVDEIHYLGSGMCKAFWLDNNNEEQIFQVWTPDSLLTLWECYFAQQRNVGVYIAAMEDSELLSITKTQLDMICMLYPEMDKAIQAARNEQMEIRNQHLQLMMKKEGDRYPEFCKVFPELRRRMVDKDVCSFLGVSRSTLAYGKLK